MAEARRVNGRATNQRTGIVHYAEIRDGRVISVLCNAEITDDYKIGKENGKRMCRRCGAAYSGSALGHYDYSQARWAIRRRMSG